MVGDYLSWRYGGARPDRAASVSIDAPFVRALEALSLPGVAADGAVIFLTSEIIDSDGDFGSGGAATPVISTVENSIAEAMHAVSLSLGAPPETVDGTEERQPQQLLGHLSGRDVLRCLFELENISEDSTRF